VSFGCASRAELTEWAARLDALGVAHGEIVDAGYGSGLSFRDPDNIALERSRPSRASIRPARRSGRPRAGWSRPGSSCRTRGAAGAWPRSSSGPAGAPAPAAASPPRRRPGSAGPRRAAGVSVPRLRPIRRVASSAWAAGTGRCASTMHTRWPRADRVR
jgi:hypothetical protein